MAQQKAERDAEKAQRVGHKGAYRGGNEDPHFDDEGFEPAKELKPYEKAFGQKTGFFSTYSPDLIEEIFLAKLKELGWENNLNVKEDKYKIKFDVTTTK